MLQLKYFLFECDNLLIDHKNVASVVLILWKE